MRNETVDDERPMRARHTSPGGASGKVSQSPIDFCGGGVALSNTVQPRDERIVRFEVCLHFQTPMACAGHPSRANLALVEASEFGVAE